MNFTEEEWESLYIDKLMVMDDVRTGAIAIFGRYVQKLSPMSMDLPDIRINLWKLLIKTLQKHQHFELLVTAFWK